MQTRLRSLVISSTVLILASFAHAADKDLERLKQSYQDAVSRAVTPINTTYEKELLKLLEQRTKAGQLAEAIEVKEEVERLTGKAIANTSEAPVLPTQPPFDKLFVGKSWRTSLGRLGV